MYLKRLELQGFKSFADKTILEFKPGITSVIGPNGSGKSNISDSIRWVLGEQSIKSLRGAKSEDIIFAGTQNRKSLGFAEASIVIDNSDGKLPIEYSEVTVTRKIYRSGETGYYINKVPCRLKDILELFMDTGIGKDGYSIIGQGKIDEILSNKSEDRRHIFEEAAGIVKYRVRKAESEKKLEQTKLNLLRINDIISEIESNIDPLKMQAEKAKQFLDLREELKNIEVGLFLYNIESYKEKLEQIVKDIEIMENHKQEEVEKQEKLQKNKDDLKIAIDNLTSKIEEVQNLGFESSNKIEKINSEISISKERIINNNQNEERIKNEIKECEERIEELEEEKKQKVEKKDSLFSNKEKFEKELDEKQEELKKIMEKMSTKELEIEGKKQLLEKYTDEKYEKSSNINAQDVNYQNIQKRQNNLKLEISEVISELDGQRDTKQELSSKFFEIENKRSKLVNEIEEVSKQKQECENKINEFDIAINKIVDEMRMKKSRLNFLIETEKEKEGYVKSVKSILIACDRDLNLKKGMHGVLANLISVDKKYETAIEMCLGASLQNIVTENEQDAKKLVEYLRKNNLGRASFLPITTVKGKKIDKIKSKTNGVIGIASDLINTDKKYRQIVESLLGRTVIVDDMDTAINLAKQNSYSFRIVTLKGDVINPSGAIQGGSVQTKTVNILGRSKEIEELKNNINLLDEKVKALQEDKVKYQESVSSVIETAKEFEKSLQEIDITYATEKQKILAIEEKIDSSQIRLSKLKQESKKNEEQKIEIQNNKEEEKRRIEEIELEVQKLNEVIQEFASLNKDNQKYVDDLNFDITNLKISVSSFDESGTSIDEMILRINQDIENNKKSIENKNNELNVKNEENKELNNKITELNNEVIEIKNLVANSSTKVEELKASRLKNNEELAKIEKDISSQFDVIEDLKEHCVKIDVKKTKLEQDLEQVINTLWEEYEITPNNAGDYKKPDNVLTTQKQVNTLRNNIKDLGSINIDAIEEYKKTKERYDFMCEQRLDLDVTAGKLRKIIYDMTETMKNQFSEKFKQINKNFSEVFVELFGGGKAELILNDEDNILECGIDIKVQPPGKKLQNMMLLSGGEKAFTAIALLFAILKINPAPFCILDEIEAALDDVNVYRYAEYLKKFSNDTQFLVITHRKGTMEAADTVYGITMEENGISKLLSMKLA
ncbi:MAG TPA: chromosome segregation protein SMC [Clostridiaceae bacterium]|nr:chromosome segregation protein SMC [Clostridiaceae bacterium]